MNFNEKLSKALEDSAEERMEEMCEVEKKHRFSLAYRLWERRTLDRLSGGVQQKVSLRRLRYMLTVTIAASLVLIGATVSAVVVANTRYSFEDHSEYSKLFIEKLHSDKEVIEEYYALPEEDGWQIKEAYVNELSTMICYKQNEKNVAFSQFIILDNYWGNVSTEKAVVEQMTLYEEDDAIYIDHATAAVVLLQCGKCRKRC